MAYVSPVLSSIKENLRKILRDESLEEAHFRSLYRENQLSIWDESLNGLDIRNRQAIEAAILASNATMIFIEHDQTFIDKVATHQLELMKYNK